VTCIKVAGVFCAAAAGHERSPGVQVSGTREEVPRNTPEIGHGHFHMENGAMNQRI